MIALAVFSIGFFALDADNWRSQIFLFGLFSVFITAWKLDRIHFLLSMSFIFAAGSALYCFSYPYSPYQQYGPYLVQKMDASAAGSLCYLWTASVLLLEIYKRPTRWQEAIGMVTLANSVYLLLNGVFRSHWWGLLSNPAMDATLIATSYPILVFRPSVTGWPKKFTILDVWKKPSFWYGFSCVVLPVIAVLLSKSSTGLGILCVAIGSYFFLSAPLTLKRVLFSCLGIGAVFSAGALVISDRNELFGDSGRFAIWRVILNFFDKAINHWVGGGTGSFYAIGEAFQQGTQGLFIWAHNDWLQVLFEQGVIGLTMAIILFVTMLKAAKNRPYLFSCVLSYGLMATFQMPLRHPVASIVGLVLIAACFTRHPRTSLSNS